MRHCKKSFCIGILLLGFLFHQAVLPYLTPEIVSSTEKIQTTDSLPTISNRFVRVIRSQQEQWMLRTPSVTVFFQPDSVIFINRISPQARVQIRLQLESPDPSRMQMKLIEERLCYSNIQDGIDIEFYLNSRENIEYDIVLKKKTSLENLHFRLSGCEVMYVENQLSWNTPYCKVMENVLSVYQQADKTPIPYQLIMDAPNVYHYRIEFPESALFPIVVDPER